MTKKDYEKFAAMFRKLRQEAIGLDLHLTTIFYVQAEIQNLFKEDNPNFNHNQFMKACLPKYDNV